MRFLLILCLCFFFNFSISAQSTQTTYTNMSLQELKSIDASSLSKADKKLYKKALKAAKKAEKKRIKEAQRAEQARIKAENKRKREKEKQRRKDHRFARNLQKTMQNIYELSRIERDDFESYFQVKGAIFKQDSGFWGEGKFGPPANYFVNIYYTPGTKEFSFILSVSKPFYLNDVDSTYFEVNQIRPEYYANINNLWPDYFRATLKGGIERNISPVSQGFVKCDPRCLFMEAVAINIEYKDLISTLSEMQDLELKISGKSGDSFILSISTGYVIGLLQRMIELDDYAYSLFGDEVISIVSIVNQMVEDTAKK